jgi:Protein of unknown function (DUF3500)
MTTWMPRLSAVAVGAVLLTGAYHRITASTQMAECANRFLAALTPEQKAKATFPFDDKEREFWAFVPLDRKGLTLGEMTPYQKQLAYSLLSAGLSQQGFTKAVTIMSLDDVLKRMENDDGKRRNPEKYYFSIFGTPAEKGTWGYRVEGHHCSQNYTVVDGKVLDAPSFFGANPAEVREGPRAGLRVLAQEEDMGRDVIQSLDPEQRKTAIVDAKAPNEILTSNSRQAALKGQASGISGTKMNAQQFEKLGNLLDMYAQNMPEQIAQYREEQIKKAGRNIYFAWAGGVNKGDPHYYRIQAPAFLIEYDDTQNNANHIHTVWRDFTGDFGEDLLKEHYQTSHRQ